MGRRRCQDSFYVERLLLEALALGGVFGWKSFAVSLLDDVCEFVGQESTLVIGCQRSGAGEVDLTTAGEGIRFKIASLLADCFSSNNRRCCGGHPGGRNDRCSDVGGNGDRCLRLGGIRGVLTGLRLLRCGRIFGLV